MKLIFLYGLPATGKFTIGEEIARLTGYKLIHNHFAADPLLAVFDFGSPPYIDLRETLWLAVIERAAMTHIPGLIFTLVPEYTIRPQFIPNLVEIAARNKVDIYTVEVTCPLPEIKQRLDNPSRRPFQKLSSIELFDALQANGAFASVPMPKADLILDTSKISAQESAQQILKLCEPPEILEYLEL